MEDDQNKVYTYLYKDRLSRGFFVGDYKIITDEYERLKEINKADFDPSKTAILEESLSEEIQVPDSSWNIVKSFNPNEIQFEIYSDKKALFVISEVFYPPGWKISIDNQPVDKIYKTDHAIQSIIIPAGNHSIVLRFDPDSFNLNLKISYASAGILYIIVIISLIMMYKDIILEKLKKHPDASSEV
jgi:uncharacterized membrane protein YfhO